MPVTPIAWLGWLLAIWCTDDVPVDYTTQIKPLLAAHCLTCHGEKKPRAKLRLDTAAGAMAGGTSGPAVVPGDPEQSELYLALIGEGGGKAMPLNRPRLGEGDIEQVRRWILQGANSPADEVPSVSTERHWAFVAPVKSALPELSGGSKPVNPIDQYIYASLERDGLVASPEADRATLARRASLDVIGLLPTPEEVESFENDQRADAYERMIDRLLASPHYGERWGRWWLDQARYADSNGYSIDAPREIWKYRDWVIDALNRDQPFDQFTIEQLAGDLLPDATTEQRVATGFHRNTQINQEGGTDPEQFRIESVIDRVGTTGSVWLGLTVACAQCHDHKYDPISQRDFYGLFAFLNSCDEPSIPVGSSEEVELQAQLRREAEEFLGTIESNHVLLELQQKWELSLDMVGRQKQSQEVRKAFDTPFEKREAKLNRVVFAAFIEQSKDEVVAAHRAHLAGIRSREPKIPSTMVMSERAEPRETHVLEGGDFTRPGAIVSPSVPGVLPALKLENERTPNRLDLARWLVSRENPLTARVTVNRIWQSYFGRGLVETENDFGTQGTPPSQPELLDWLAVELVDQDWSLKAIHREILISATYRQSSRSRSDLAASDPENRLLARQSRLRLEAELVRDSALRASGLLATQIGGPSVFPPQPDGVMTMGQMRRDWTPSEGPDRYRRGLYTFFWRATPHPLLTGLDAPDGNRTCTRRPRSNTPLQALMLLNDAAWMEFANALAKRMVEESSTDDDERLARGFKVCLGRQPDEVEAQRLAALLGAERSAGDEQSAWVAVARVMLNLDEFLTRE
jgi:mono/diheme cytochrome c family protein